MEKIIGLTGGIASGKSTVADILSARKNIIIDTDIISRELTQIGGAANDELKKVFPSVYSDGVLDRLKLRKLVFESMAERKKLNAVMQPLIKKKAKEMIEDNKNSNIILVVPLMFEAGFDSLVDICITISCYEELRIQRLVNRDNISVELAKKMLASQMSDSKREKLSDYVIYNNAGLEELKVLTEEIYKKIIQEV